MQNVVRSVNKVALSTVTLGSRDTLNKLLAGEKKMLRECRLVQVGLQAR